MLQISKVDMDRLVMQYLVTEGYKVSDVKFENPNRRCQFKFAFFFQEAAEQFEKDTDIHPEVELSTIGGLNSNCVLLFSVDLRKP